MKRHQLRRLRASLLSNQFWSIHEPALAALLGVLESAEAGATTGRGFAELINAALGISAQENQASIQMVGSVAVLPIFGVLQPRATWITRYLGWTATEQLEADVKSVLASDQVKAVILYCDSPGGVTAGIEEAAATIFAGRKVKPIVAFARGLMCSACYHLGAAASRIVATPSSSIGSIGTIYTHIEYSEMLAKAGIQATVIKHGARKGDGNPYERLTPESKAALQKWVTAYGELFDQAVAKFRGVDVATVRGKFGQGQAFIASEAKERGLVDAVGSWEQLLKSFSTPAAPLPQQLHAAQGRTDSGNVAATFDSALAAFNAPAPREAVWLFNEDIASANPAGVSAGPTLPAVPGTGESNVDKKLKAWLMSRGLIDSIDAADDVCRGLLTAWFGAYGKPVPASDAETLKALHSMQLEAAATPLKGETAAPPATPAANVQAAHDREMEEAKKAGQKTEKERAKAIRASGKVLQLDAATIDAAIDGGETHETIIAGWHKTLAEKEKAIGQDAVVTGDGHTRFVADATLGLLNRMDRVGAKDQPKLTEDIQRLGGAPLSYFAEQCLRAAGVRADFHLMPREELFEIAFAMDGPGRVSVGANYTAYNRPGSFPNLLSNLANKVLDAALELSSPTYPEWTGQVAGDLPDFKAVPIVNKSQPDEMDEILDAEASKEFGLTEEMLSYMVLRRFSNKFVLTPVMGANDDLNAFDEGLVSLESAWQNTVNRLCLYLLTGNVVMLDTFALFDDTNHGNDLTGTGSGPPSTTSWDAMQQKVSAQRGIGGTGYVRTPLSVALVPPKHWVAALQTFATLQQLGGGEQKAAATDANINVFRGTATVVKEVELQANSVDIWYGLARPRGTYNATVIRAYFRGWGKNGRRQRWHDPETKCWNFELEGRVGAAAKQYRLAVRNDGVA